MGFTKKGALLVTIFLSLSVFLLSSASAEILLGQTNSLYNLGDRFDLTITLHPQTSTSDFVTGTLICGSREIELLKSPVSLDAGEEKQVEISTKLDRFLVSSMKGGDCYVKAKYGSESANTPKFSISNDLTVTISVQGVAFNPGDIVEVSGQATKATGDPLDGFVEISVKDIDVSVTNTVASGQFSVNFTVPSDAPAGSYQIKARAYGKDASGQITNEGNATAIMRINQVIKDLEIALNKQSLQPTEDLEYTVLLYDQAKDEAEFDVPVSIYKADDSLFDKKVVRAGTKNILDLNPSSMPGYWRIEADYESLHTVKEFLIEEYEDVSFTLINQTLVVTNVGNVPFSGAVQVKIGGISEVKDVKDLAVSESIKYRLSGMNDNYHIVAGTGSEEREVGTAFLTGKAISVNESGNSFFGSSFVVLLGLVIVLVLAIVVVLVYKKYSKRRALSGGAPVSSLKPSGPGAGSVHTTNPVATTQSQHVIDKGEKQEASIVSVKIRNLNSLSDDSKKAIDSALWKAKEAGAKIYSDGEFRIIILSQVLTKEKDNVVKGIELAQTIDRMLKAYNHRSAQKIDFGLGVNHGTLIVESIGGKFRFMSLNNVIAITKRISDNANEEILISEAVHRRTVGRVKAEKLRDKNLWKVDKVTDRTLHSDYVRHMTSKHKEEGAHHRAGHSSHDRHPRR